MQMVGADQAGRNVAADGMAAEGTLLHLNQMEEERCRAFVRMEFTDQFLPRKNAMNGLASAIPLSLFFWAMLALLLWALVR